jgi:hypothetical protein
MFKDIDLRPVRSLEKAELIERVYSLSDENQRLKERIKAIRANVAPKTIYVKQVQTVTVDRVKVIDKSIDKSIEKEERDIKFCCDLIDVSLDMLLEKGKGFRKGARAKARCCISYVLRQRNYISSEVAMILDVDSSSARNAALRYRISIPELQQFQISCYLKDYYDIDDNAID